MQTTNSERSSIKDDSSQLGGLSFSQSKLGWILLTLVGILTLSNTTLFFISVWFQSTFGVLVSYALAVNCLIIFAVCVALIDVAPAWRIILFALIPMILYSLTSGLGLVIFAFSQFGIGIGIAGEEQVYLIPLWGLFLMMSISSMIWLIRWHRGWTISRTSADEGESLVTPKNSEFIGLLVWIVLASLPLSFSQPLWSLLGAFAAWGAFGVLIVLPLTYLMMRTGRPWTVGSLIGLGLPTIVLLAFFCLQLPQYRQSGIMLSAEAKMAFWGSLAFLFFPILFFWGLRLVGFRLVVPEFQLPKPALPLSSGGHALDD